MARRAVITGIGLVSGAGVGREAHIGCADRLDARPTALALFDGSTMPVQAAFQVSRPRPAPFMKRRKDLKLMSRDAQLALQAAGLALTDALIAPMDPDAWPIPPEEAGLFMGVGLEPGNITELGYVAADCSSAHHGIDLHRLGGSSIDLIPPLSALKTLPNMALAHISINLGMMGPGEALSPWGTAGIAALGVAVESIERGECEMALVGASDSDVDLGGVSTHARLGLAARLTAAQAQSSDLWSLDGFVLGEGAAFLVVEDEALALRRGAHIVARVGAVASRTQSGAALAAFDAGCLRTVVNQVRAGGDLVTGVGGHWAAWRAAEAEALGGDLLYPSRATGWCAAASGLLDLGAALATACDRGYHGGLVGAAWSPGGDCAAVRCEVME